MARALPELNDYSSSCDSVIHKPKFHIMFSLYCSGYLVPWLYAKYGTTIFPEGPSN